jgi:cyclohexyl-isocyanide hydratase
MEIGSLLFPGIDQIDLTGPFEVFSRIPDASYRVYAQSTAPVRDVRGLILCADATLDEAPPLDILHVPGGYGQEALMENAAVLDWIRRQAAQARIVFSVCTGALVLGAAGLLVGRRATTHWASHHLLARFGAEPVHERVVVDGRFVFASGVTSGLDGALRVAAMIAGDDAARRIQLEIEYAPEPPFDAGSPETAPPHIVAAARHGFAEITARREATVARLTGAIPNLHLRE